MRDHKGGSSATGGRRECTGVINDLSNLFAPLLSLANRNTGFHQFKCPLCRDYKVRAGIRISGTSIGFNCFNCSKATRYTDGDCYIPEKLAQVFTALGGSQHDLNMIKFKLMSSPNAQQPMESEVLVDGVNIFRSPPPIEMPKEMITVEEALLSNEPQGISVAKYLLDQRQYRFDPTKVFVAITRKRENPWLDRAIFPVIMWNKVVGLTGRDTSGKSSKKYHTEGPKGRSIFNHDIMGRHPERPLFIFEGQFDALRMDGIAVLGNTISDHQYHWISACERQLVVVPDRGRDGLKLAMRALELGWSISLPDIGSCKDVDEAVVQYGKLYCLDRMLSSITVGEIAGTKARLYCLGERRG